MQALESKQEIQVQRTIKVKTLLTDAFRETANREHSSELQKVEDSIRELKNLAQERLNEIMQSDISDADKQLAQAHIQQQFDQEILGLLTAKQELLARQDALAKSPNGSYISTGEIKDLVTLKVGDNIYERLRGAEILVKDGVITAIVG